MVGKNVTYSHNVVVSFTAQNQQALIQATQNADRALQSYNRTMQQNVTQLSNVTRAQQSYQTSLNQVSTQTTNMGRNVATMNSQFSAGVTPIKNSGNALNQFNATTIQSGTSLNKFGGFMKNNLTNVALLSGGIAGLDDQFHRMTKAQVGAERANLILDKAEQKVVKTEEALQDMREKGLQGTDEYAIKLKDLEINQEAVTIAQDRASVAQTTLSEATEEFWVGILPNMLFIGGSVASMISSMGLNMTKLKGVLPAITSGFSGLVTAFSKIDTAKMAAGFVTIGAPILAAVAAIWLLVGAYQGLSNVSNDIIDILNLQVEALNPLQLMYLKIQDTLSNLNLAPKLTEKQKADLNFYDKLTPAELDKMKKKAEEKGAKLGESFLGGFTDPKPITDIARKIATGVSGAFSGAFDVAGQEIAEDPTIENALGAAIVQPTDRVAQQIKEPSQAISETMTDTFGKAFQDPVRNSSELLNEVGIVFDETKGKVEEWDKKVGEVAVATAHYNNVLALTTGNQKLINAGLEAGTISAGEFLAEIVTGKAEVQGFNAEMQALADEDIQLAQEFINLKNTYDLTNEEAKGFFETQASGGDTLEYLAKIINEKAGPALEHFNSLFETETKKDFKKDWKDKKKELEKMGLDDDTIDLMEKNANRKRDVVQDIDDMTQALEGIALIGIDVEKTKGSQKALNDLADEIIESYDEIQASDDRLAGVTGFEDYVKKVIASGDPSQLKNLDAIIQKIDMFWQNDQRIDPTEAAIIQAMINTGTAADDAAPKVDKLSEAEDKIIENVIMSASIDLVTKSLDAQGTAAANTTSFTEDLDGAMSDLSDSNKSASGTINTVAKNLNLMARAVRGTTKDVGNLTEAMNDIPNIKRTITITTIKKTRNLGETIRHGGSFLRNAQHGMAGIITRPTSMDGFLMGEHSKPELITVTPLTNPNNVADTSVKLSARTNDSGSKHLLTKILAAIESIRLDARFKIEGNDIVKTKDIFAAISPLIGKQQARYG